MTGGTESWPIRLRPSAAEREMLRSLTRDLSILDLDAPPVANWASSRIQSLLGAEGTLVYTTERLDGSHQLGQFALAGIGAERTPRLRARGDLLMRGTNGKFSLYDPDNVDRLQRNAVLIAGTVRETSENRMPAAFGRAMPSKRQRDHHTALLHASRWWFEEWGVLDAHNLRVLLCEGQRLVGYVGALQHGAFDKQQRALLQALIAPLQRRFLLEERIGAAAQPSALVPALLEEIAGAAYVLNGAHRVVACNTAGRMRLAKDARRAEVLKRAARAGGDPSLTLVDLSTRGVPSHALLIERPSFVGGAPGLALIGKRYALTPREVEVLGYLGRGVTNRGIAVALKCSERTVETHVSRILNKADCASRSELVALLWASHA